MKIDEYVKIDGKLSKREIVVIVLLALGVVVTVLSFVFANEIFGYERLAEDGVTMETVGSVFAKQISKNSFINSVYSKWIPALIESVRVITITCLVSMAVIFIMRRFFGKTNRGITISKLVESFIKWIVAIISILLVLSTWGVNTAALITSAGILTLVIGLGAQSLVADIVAGIFIVFEGEFQVGDIVIVNGWRGTVQEIGMRTTKIIDAGGNVSIINNSTISTVINQTRSVSLAKCIIGIEYKESIERVEKVIAENLAKVGEKIPAIIDGPYYKGIEKLNSSSVDLLFIAHCKEEDIYQVQRDMNREIKLIFDENDFNIPFPQIVVNKRESNEPASSSSKIADSKT